VVKPREFLSLRAISIIIHKVILRNLDKVLIWHTIKGCRLDSRSYSFDPYFPSGDYVFGFCGVENECIFSMSDWEFLTTKYHYARLTQNRSVFAPTKNKHYLASILLSGGNCVGLATAVSKVSSLPTFRAKQAFRVEIRDFADEYIGEVSLIAINGKRLLSKKFKIGA
jgi:hypothetical protein